MKPATANEAITCCEALVRGVTLLTRFFGVAFNTCVFKDIIDNPIPEPIKNNTHIMSANGVSVRTKDIINKATVINVMPPSRGGRAPTLSKSLPAIGIKIMEPTA